MGWMNRDWMNGGRGLGEWRMRWCNQKVVRMYELG